MPLTKKRYGSEMTFAADMEKTKEYMTEDVGRLEPWSFLLNVAPSARILAVGVGSYEAISLGMFYNSVDLWECGAVCCYGLPGRAEIINHPVQFNKLEQIFGGVRYDAVVVGPAMSCRCSAEKAFELLKPGGSVVWIGGRGDIPPVAKLTLAGFESVIEYLQFKLNGERTLALVNNNKSIQVGLNLYTPGKLHGRLALWLGRWISKAGLFAGLAHGRFAVARKGGGASSSSDDAYLLGRLNQLLGTKIDRGNMYIGKTKLVFQLLDMDRNVAAIAKVAGIPIDTSAIERETGALTRFERVPATRDSVPKVLAVGNWQGHAVQIQTAMPGQHSTFKAALTRQHLDFLINLTRIDLRPLTLKDWPNLTTLRCWARSGVFSSPREREVVRATFERCQQSLDKVLIPFHRVHGDFAPWNVLWRPDGLVVLDWEESDPQGLPLCDAINFTLRVAITLKKKSLPLENLLLEQWIAQETSEKLRLLSEALLLERKFGFTQSQLDALIQLSILHCFMGMQTG